MARFPAIRRWTGLAAGTVFLVGSGLAAAPSGAPAARLDEFGRQYGLQVSWVAPGRQLRLSSRWTRLEFAAGSREASWNGIRLFLGEPVRPAHGTLCLSPTDRDDILQPLLAPAAAPVPGDLRLIAIDAGHGGGDPGTENTRLALKEKTLTLDVARRLKRDLEQRGYRVMLTRNTDIRLARTQVADLRRRAELANRAGADLFISIHFNSLPDQPAVGGVETYALTPAGQRSTSVHAPDPPDNQAYAGNRFDHWNAVLSAALHRRLLEQLGTTDRGLKRARFAVLREIKCPAVLVEAGFLSNPAEARKVGTPAYRQDIAEAIGDGVGDYDARLHEAAAVD